MKPRKKRSRHSRLPWDSRRATHRDRSLWRGGDYGRPLRHSAQVTLEDGAVLSFDKALPGNLPAGYHTLRYLDQERDTKLIVSPGVCHMPERLRICGWSR